MSITAIVLTKCISYNCRFVHIFIFNKKKNVQCPFRAPCHCGNQDCWR